MKKMKTVFVVNRETDLATREVRKECDWVLNGEGKATIKFDGTAAMWKDNTLYKRWDRKLTKKWASVAKRKQRQGVEFTPSEDMFKAIPEGAIPCEENPDVNTFHFPYWIPVDLEAPENAWFKEAMHDNPDLVDGATYELIGLKIQDNIYNLDKHKLIKHGSGNKITDLELTFDGIKKWLAQHNVEGIVFHHPDGRKAKIRRKDLFNFYTLHGGRKIDWRDENVDFSS